MIDREAGQRRGGAGLPMSKTPRRLFTSWIRVLLLVGLLGLPILAGCDAGFPEESGEGPGHRSQHLGLLPDQELAIGQQAYRQVLSENRGRILPADDPQVRRVRSIVVRIVRAAGIEPLQREINLRLLLPGTLIEPIGEISWADIQGRAGIRFTDMAPRDVRELQRWLDGQRQEERKKPIVAAMRPMKLRAVAAKQGS